MIKICLLTAWLCGAGVSTVQAQLGAEFGNLSAQNVRMPLYNNGEVRFMVSAQKLNNAGTALNGELATIDMIRSGVDVDDIMVDTGDIYTIAAPIADVIRFWVKRRGSEGVIFTDKVALDTNKKSAEGAEIVQVRTPLMDIDGVGFVANYETREISIKQNVHIRLRFGGSEFEECIATNSPLKAAANPELNRSADVWADTMVVDFGKKRIELLGNVKMRDGNAEIFTDKVIIVLGGANEQEPENEADNNKSILSPQAAGVSGVESLECLGNVKLVRSTGDKPEDKQTLNAEYAKYDFATQKIVVSGNRPAIRSGNNELSADEITLEQDKQRLTAAGACRLQAEIPEVDGSLRQTVVLADNMQFSYPDNYAEAFGNVRINDSRGTLLAHKMIIKLKDDAASTKAGKMATGIAGMNGMEFSGTNKSVEVIECVGGVNFYGKDGEEGQAENVRYDYESGAIVLAGNQPWVSQGGNRLEGEEIVLEQKSQRLLISRNAKIVMIQQSRSGVSGVATTVATCDVLDMNYAGNICVLNGNVHIQDALANVECDKMTIFLTAKGENTTLPELGGSALAGGDKFDKTLERIVCSGNVKGRDPRGALDCDTLTAYFFEGPAGTELDRITADDNIRLKATGVALADGLNQLEQTSEAGKADLEDSSLTAEHGVIDMRNNVVEFKDNVRIMDSRAQISAGRFQAFLSDAIPTADGGIAAPVTEESLSPELMLEPDYQNSVPNQVSIGDKKNLTKLSFTENVLITGKDQSGTEFTARGEQADYIVSERLIRMPKVNGVRPLLGQGKKITENDEVEVDLASGSPEPRGKGIKIISFDGI